MMLGFAMFIFGFISCLLRLIIFQPRIFPCFCPAKKINKQKTKSSAFYTAANSALRVSFAIPVRYGRNNSLVGLNSLLFENQVKFN